MWLSDFSWLTDAFLSFFQQHPKGHGERRGAARERFCHKVSEEFLFLHLQQQISGVCSALQPGPTAEEGSHRAGGGKVGPVCGNVFLQVLWRVAHSFYVLSTWRFIQQVNQAAVAIQRWYRRLSRRKQSHQAALEQILANKRKVFISPSVVLAVFLFSLH